MNFIEAFKGWCKTVRMDWQHATCGTQYYMKGKVPIMTYFYVPLSTEFQIVFLYRIYSGLHQRGLPVIPMLLYLITKFLYKSDLYPKAKIGAGLLLVHGFDVVVGANAVLGNNTVIFNGVSVGKKNVGVAGAGMPMIGDDCVLGTGAKILGPVTIGNNVTIGANSVVVKDLPSNSICAGNPAKVVKTENI